jgi:hypothetical protein
MISLAVEDRSEGAAQCRLDVERGDSAEERAWMVAGLGGSGGSAGSAIASSMYSWRAKMATLWKEGSDVAF